jgi:hypothetical protein
LCVRDKSKKIMEGVKLNEAMQKQIEKVKGMPEFNSENDLSYFKESELQPIIELLEVRSGDLYKNVQCVQVFHTKA